MRHCFKFFSLHLHLQLHPHPHPACLSPLPTLYNGPASAPPQTPRASWIGSLVPDAQASQLCSQPRFASWHPQGKLVACLPPFVGRTPPSFSLPDLWSTRATDVGDCPGRLGDFGPALVRSQAHPLPLVVGNPLGRHSDGLSCHQPVSAIPLSIPCWTFWSPGREP